MEGPCCRLLSSEYTLCSLQEWQSDLESADWPQCLRWGFARADPLKSANACFPDRRIYVGVCELRAGDAETDRPTARTGSPSAAGNGCTPGYAQPGDHHHERW